VASKKRLMLQVLAYLLYAVVVMLLILYITFPYERLGQRMAERISQGDLQLAIARLGPTFPPGVQLQQLRLLPKALNPPIALVQMDTLRMHPNLLTVFSKAMDIRLDAALYSGHMHGNVQTTLLNSTAPWDIKTHFSDVHMEQHPWLQKDGQAFLRGRLGGDLSLTVTSEGTLQQGTLNLRLEPAILIGNQDGLIPLPRDVTCETVQSQLRLTAGQLQIDSFTCRGDDLMIQVKGMVRWQQPLAASALDLKIEMRSENTYKQELELLGNLVRRRLARGVLAFSLRGTLQEPRPGA
jgi:type II secretion system protein N